MPGCLNVNGVVRIGRGSKKREGKGHEPSTQHVQRADAGYKEREGERRAWEPRGRGDLR